MNRPIYLDYAATTPVSPEVLEAMIPYFSQHFGNSGSNQHLFGWEASDAVDQARKTISSYFSVNPSSILFTSGATESNNLALLGLLEEQTPGHIISSPLEHKAVLEPLAYLAHKGWEITYLEPNSAGEICLEQIKTAKKSDTRLVSLMWVNNEIGVINDISSIAQWCNQEGIYCHTDATQALGKLDLSQAFLPDLLSFSGHKIFGPKGIGALSVKSGIPLKARQWGGAQERGLRAGTLPIPLIVGLAKAVERIPHLLTFLPQIQVKKQDLENSLKESLGDSLIVNSISENQIPHILNFSIQGVDWEKLFRCMPLLAFSNGSACNSKSTFPSHVLKALGRDNDTALASIRISLAQPYLNEDHDWVKDYLVKSLEKLIS
ncbi:cysteine desulfurase family protein [Aquirufa aurantiipilula]